MALHVVGGHDLVEEGDGVVLNLLVHVRHARHVPALAVDAVPLRVALVEAAHPLVVQQRRRVRPARETVGRVELHAEVVGVVQPPPGTGPPRPPSAPASSRVAACRQGAGSRPAPRSRTRCERSCSGSGLCLRCPSPSTCARNLCSRYGSTWRRNLLRRGRTEGVVEAEGIVVSVESLVGPVGPVRLQRSHLGFTEGHKLYECDPDRGALDGAGRVLPA